MTLQWLEMGSWADIGSHHTLSACQVHALRQSDVVNAQQGQRVTADHTCGQSVPQIMRSGAFVMQARAVVTMTEMADRLTTTCPVINFDEEEPEIAALSAMPGISLMNPSISAG